MQNLNGQGFHVASGRGVLGYTVGGTAVQSANVDMRSNLLTQDVLQATNDEVAGMDPLDILIQAQEAQECSQEYSQDVIPPSRGVSERKGKGFPAGGRNDESGGIARNFVELAALNVQPMRPRGPGFRDKKTKHKTNFGNVVF